MHIYFYNHETHRLLSKLTSIPHGDADTGPSVPADAFLWERTRRRKIGIFVLSLKTDLGYDMIDYRFKLAKDPLASPCWEHCVIFFIFFWSLAQSVSQPTQSFTPLFTLHSLIPLPRGMPFPFRTTHPFITIDSSWIYDAEEPGESRDMIRRVSRWSKSSLSIFNASRAAPKLQVWAGEVFPKKGCLNWDRDCPGVGEWLLCWNKNKMVTREMRVLGQGSCRPQNLAWASSSERAPHYGKGDLGMSLKGSPLGACPSGACSGLWFPKPLGAHCTFPSPYSENASTFPGTWCSPSLVVLVALSIMQCHLP